MRNFYNTCKFSALAINFSEVWPRQIRDLGKQFKLMIHLETFLKTFLQDALKVSSRCLEDVFKMSWRRFEDVLKTFLQDVLKASWERLEDVLARRFENVLKISWRFMTKANILVLIKTSWRRLLKMKRKDIFIKTNVCWNIMLLYFIIVSLLHVVLFSCCTI